MAGKYRKRSKAKTGGWVSVLVLIVLVIWDMYSGGSAENAGKKIVNDLTGQSSVTNTINNASVAQKAYGGLSKSDYDKLAKLDFKSGGQAYIVVNHDKSTLIKNAWKVNRVIYSNLDHLNRTSHSNTGFLEKEMLLMIVCVCVNSLNRQRGIIIAVMVRKFTIAAI